MIIHIDFDENDPDSYWAAAVELRAAANAIEDDHLRRVYFPESTPVEWWAETLDRLGLPQDAGVDRCGRALRGEGLTIPTKAVQWVVKARRDRR